ncbi:unnamed protein product [Parajaminaea phylloscopi]
MDSTGASEEGSRKRRSGRQRLSRLPSPPERRSSLTATGASVNDCSLLRNAQYPMELSKSPLPQSVVSSESNATAHQLVNEREGLPIMVPPTHLSTLRRSFTFPSKRKLQNSLPDIAEADLVGITPSLSSPATALSRDQDFEQRPMLPNPRLSLAFHPERASSPVSVRASRIPFYITRRYSSAESFQSADDPEDATKAPREPGLRGRVTSFDVGNWTYAESRPRHPLVPLIDDRIELSRVYSEPTAGPMIRRLVDARTPTQAREPVQEMSEGIATAVRKIVEAEYRKRLAASKGRGREFWRTFAAVFVTAFLSAIDLTIISPILPTIAEEMPRSNISPLWITSAFLTTSASFQPLFGGLSDAIGRREALMLATLIFLAGTIVACVARDMLTIIVGRGIQGLGGGGMTVVGQVIMSDMTTLAERGYFLGLTSIAFALAALGAPVAGGWFATFDWRLAFYINFPIGAIAIALIVPLKLSKPALSLGQKIQRMDLIGSSLLFASITALLFGLTNGGVVAPWNSPRTIVPLVCGAVGMVLFVLVEFLPTPFTQHPLLPAALFRHRTASIAYALTFLHGMLLYGATQGLVLFFENRGDSPLRAAINILPANTPSTPAAFIAGFLMAVTGRYKELIIVCEGFMTLGMGLCISLAFDAPATRWASFQIIASIGLGALYALTLPPVQATLPSSELAHATAAYAFARSFGAVWGVSIFLIAFQIQTGKELGGIPAAGKMGLTGATAIDFVPAIALLPLDLRGPIQAIFHRAFQHGIKVILPFSALGFLLALFMQHVPLPDFNDSQYGLKDRPTVPLEGVSHPRSPSTVPEKGAVNVSGSTFDLERQPYAHVPEGINSMERHYGDRIHLMTPLPSLSRSDILTARATDSAQSLLLDERRDPIYSRKPFPSQSTTAVSTAATASTWATTMHGLRRWLQQFTFDRSTLVRQASRASHTLFRSRVSSAAWLGGESVAVRPQAAATRPNYDRNVMPVQPDLTHASWRESMNELHRRTVEVERRYEAIYAELSPSASHVKS